MLTERELQTLRNLGNESEAAAEEIERLRQCLATLRRYVAIEGQDTKGKFIALAYDGSIIGPMLRDNYDPWEFGESVENWLRNKVDAALVPNVGGKRQ